MRRTVRRITMAAVGVSALLVVGAVGYGTWAYTQARHDTVGVIDFTRPLAIPPLAESHLDADGRRVFHLTAAQGRHDFGSGSVETWGFDGAYLGPTIRAERGDDVVVNVLNDLDEPTTVHWHGMELPAAMDGGPHQEIDPGETWSPSWRIDQPAATLWYHPHPHGTTEKHVYRGLAGMFIVDDETDPGLPADYGVDDIPVIVQDKNFSARGGRLSERRSFFSDSGLLGDTIVVNGVAGPYLDVTTELVRLRILNGSTARTYNLGFDDDRQFDLVGTDGGLLAEPHATTRVMLSPGERAEIVVAMEPGERTIMRGYPAELGVRTLGRFFGADDTFDILELRGHDHLEARAPVPERLAGIDRLDPSDAVTTRSFELSGRKVNGQRMDMSRIDAVVESGSIETWRVRNTDGFPHNFHVHGLQFQVTSVAGAPPPPELAGWKDTIYLPPGVEFELVARFPVDSDPEIPFMFHCHLLYHEDAGMMGQFLVVDDPSGHPEIPRAAVTRHDHH